MQIKGWRYYNRAAIPTTAPHIEPDMTPIQTGDIWQLDGRKPLLVRWTTDFDCGYETNWWYVIKDKPFDVSALKAKRRYEINKGIRNFEVRQIDPREHAQALCDVAFAAYAEYPAAYRPSTTRDQFLQNVQNWNFYRNYGAFDRETNQLCGYALLLRDGNYIDFINMKAMPAAERQGVNAALVNGMLEDQASFLAQGGYICDGARSINYETAFQDYLEKYFGFRKVYCKLHIRYKGVLGFAIKCLYPFRKWLRKLDRISKIHLLNSLLKMEEFTSEREKKA